MNVTVSLIILFLIIEFTIMMFVSNDVVLNNKTQLDNLQDVCQNHQDFNEVTVNKNEILVTCSDNTKLNL